MNASGGVGRLARRFAYVFGLLVLYCGLAAWMRRPVSWHPAELVVGERLRRPGWMMVDVYEEIAILGAVAQGVAVHPTSLYDIPFFFPERRALRFFDHLLGQQVLFAPDGVRRRR